ncbi:PTS sugar transporter subunit IIA [Mobilicoccus caccae]|uniref:Ascorbate-specific PTS system EIIA component n=1 Tax=Mobilicoccus caccae TaxID=1859295 RepID=A0ABQ6IYV3_9MICO|nr:PTS sugar transporter subunit IIA [Mobilicoccus caccae]GMA42256.1 PTS sugar transporter [Mobilicoccus caccae]
MPSLSEIVDPSAIRLDVAADDWRAAIRAAGGLLVSTGVSGDSYTEEMIGVVERYGPYIVIAPGFAFAHSRRDDSVRRTGMSVVRLASPVTFGHDTNDPVTLVVALAAADDDSHRKAMASLAGLIAQPDRRAAMDEAATPQEMHRAFTERAAEPDRQRESTTPQTGPAQQSPSGDGTAATAAAAANDTSRRQEPEEDTVASKGFILTVCGNGLGTSLFLKNTLEGVLDHWGWGRFVRVEATDTISARGRAQEADVLFTSGAIAEALGDVGVPVEVIQDFTSSGEIDDALRRVYAVDTSEVPE